MHQKLRSRLTYANVMATLAVFLALGGAGAYATHEAIFSSDIVDGEVKNPDIADNAVSGSKIVDNSIGSEEVTDFTTIDGPRGGLKAVDLANDSVTRFKIPDNAVGITELDDRAVAPTKICCIPAARAVKTVNQPVPQGTQVALRLQAEQFDTFGLHDPTVNNTRLTAPISGVYQVSAGVVWQNRSTGDRRLLLGVNGGCCSSGSEMRAASVETVQTTSDLLKLSAGDFVEARVFQNSGSGLQARASAATFLAMHWVAPG